MVMQTFHWLVTAVVIAALCSCGGNGAPSAPTSPGSTSPTPPPASLFPLPSGSASGGTIPCPFGVSGAAACTSLIVSCPSISIASATLVITRPVSATLNRGTVVLTTGGDGTNVQDSPLTPAMVSTLNRDGLSAVQVAWSVPGIWGGPRARTLACRYATVARWIYDNVHVGGRSTLFAAQGTSGGSAQIAFGLAHYGLGDFLDLASLGGGPPGCPLCSPDGTNALEPLLPAPAPASSRDPNVSYPGTVVRFFLGDQEPTPAIVTDANAYYAVIRSAKSFTNVPGTAHNIEGTQAGVDAYVAAVRAALK